MKRALKFISTLCVLTLMLTALAACGGSKPAPATDGSQATPDTSNDTETASKDVPTLTWWTIGGQVPNNFSKAVDAMNAYTAEKIGVKVDIKVASWGEWDTKMNTIVNTGEPFDIMFTNSGKYSKQVAMGAFADITDLVQSETPDLYKLIPEKVWEGTKIGGKYYSVPTYKDSALTQYWVFDDKYVQKYNIDINNIKTLQDLDKPLHDMKAGEGKSFYPLPMTQGEGLNGFFNDYDDLTLGFPPIGVKADDASRTVVSVLEQPDVVANLKLLHQWYQDGIINPDAPTKTENDKGRPFFAAQAFPGAEISWQINDAIEKYDMVQHYGPIYTTSTIQGSLNAISANSKYKKEALKYLELVNTDPKLRNMLAFGELGVDYNNVDGEKVIERTSDTWPLAAYTQGTFFNLAVTKGAPEDQWEQVKKLNDAATSSTVLGFALDITDLQTEVANCQAVWDKYKYEIITGASDPEKVIPKVTAELKSAGMDTIMQAAQEQINNYFK
ncbi:ABC transporter substrate-binding protein [Paenibacillus sp. FSL H8-0457]|uniref:ABC transporter substrate-binding protein n=1 Tax=Bacillales TaxID=1385 RepID=UPI0001788D63|nr:MULTISPECIES: ABC transporter substrate-binding protein [Paenibacillus]ACX67023.1 extracellular solute-binding protein family 1 [Paenibacillus sp. Y412MC10]ETT67973.1 family 1 extracellular solute-binding protein [Paenibacillus sp. FSL H8-457]MCM3259490.1 ABC transporter substrate-binding protein [Paenibacillus lautus]QOT10801.1 ABC transporter substrate-binding protein [Paenibacillus sp. JNUCC-32]